MRLTLLRTGAFVFAVIGVLLGSAAQAKEPAELIADRIHSDLPLYTFAWEDLWPRSFSGSEDGSFGCLSSVRFGDWHFISEKAGEDAEESWARYSNYGVFHCAAVIREADERSELDEAEWKYGFFVRLGETRFQSKRWELWAIQRGTVPGSDYSLFAREVSQQGGVTRFRVEHPLLRNQLSQ